MVCPRCGRDNPPENLYCARCGLEFAKLAKDQPPPNPDEVMYCHWHPKVATSLSCGRCERPVCTKCVVIGPAGVRCKECSKTKINVSARGIAHDVTRPIGQTIGALARQPYMIFILLMLFGGLFRGCAMICAQPQRPPVYDRSNDEDSSPPRESKGIEHA
jgi:hypothetical protein